MSKWGLWSRPSKRDGVGSVAMKAFDYVQSSYGRENGLAALEHYTQLKSVYVEMVTVESSF